MRNSSLFERDFIRSLRRQTLDIKGPLRLGIGDDCAILPPPKGTEIVVTTDFSLENRHFRRDWHPPQSAGHRCLARGLSDLAAMGAKPLAAFLSIAVPKNLEKAYLDGFLKGFLALAKTYGVPLAGGDTAAAPGDELFADVTLLGTVPQGKALLRSGAKAGDGIYVTGHMGASAAELELLSSKRGSRLSGPKARTILAWGNAPGRRSAKGQSAEGAPYRSSYISEGNHPHLFPQPRLAVGQTLLKRRLATAAIDVSDGLSVDLLHLCEESKLDAEINTNALPLGGTLTQALHGGEDYELLFTASRPVPKKLAGIPITRIGTMLPRAGRSPRMGLIDEKGKRTRLKPQGWEHQL